MARAVIDPLTRIEGHLRVECEVENGKITDAWVSGALYRGMELVLKGRKPADAYYISQRICGVCPISHGHASSMATEAALGVTIPNGARIVRNIIESAEFLHSHILWFYTLAALDYVNPAKALEANIADTYALAQAAGTTTSDFKGVQDRVKTLVAGGDLSIFSGAWIDHPELFAEKMPAELHLIAVAHYLEALEMQAEAARIIAVMGGKFPHFMTSVPGGTSFVPTEEKLDDVLFRMTKVVDFINKTMIPDTLAIAPYYLGAAAYGGGTGNFLAWGVFNREDLKLESRYLPSGFIDAKTLLAGGKASEVDEKKVLEFTSRSWLAEGKSGLNPQDGETIPPAAFPGYDVNKEYSWAKAPRYDGKSAEVGPLARMLVAYSKGVPEVKSTVDGALAALSKAAGAPIGAGALVSLIGRVAARNLEAAVIGGWALGFVNELIGAVKAGGLEFYKPIENTNGKGGGLWEAPRGALGHWINVENGVIANYQVCTPSTWDISPRDDKGVRGPMEEALVGTPIADVERPIEAARVARSFDP